MARALDGASECGALSFVQRGRRGLELCDVAQNRSCEDVIRSDRVVHAKCVVLEGGGPVQELADRGVPRLGALTWSNVEPKVNPRECGGHGAPVGHRSEAALFEVAERTGVERDSDALVVVEVKPRDAGELIEKAGEGRRLGEVVGVPGRSPMEA